MSCRVTDLFKGAVGEDGLVGKLDQVDANGAGDRVLWGDLC